MRIPVQVSFSNMTSSDAIRARVEELAGRLDRFHDRITSCRVVVRAPNKRQRKGRLYHVGIDLTMPGHEIVVNRNPPENQAHEDVYVAIRDAFDALIRRVEDAARQDRGDIKTHEAPAHGRVVRLFPKEGYGFIEDSTLGEIYFHANCVSGGSLGSLKVGAEVWYRAENGEKGMQATVVEPVGNHQAPH